MRLIDLSITLGPAVEPVPRHPRVQAEPLTTLERDGANNTLVTFSIHTGTHIDAPLHFIPGGKTMDEIPLDRLCGRAWLCDLRQVIPRQDGVRHQITVEDLKRGGLPPGGLKDVILTLFSGWAEEHWDKPDFYTANPYLHESASRWLAEEGIKALALDFGVDGARPWPNHPTFLSQEICLIENLVNLEAILPDRDFTMYALPVKMRENGGSARVIVQL
jgi:arylformamidase